MYEIMNEYNGPEQLMTWDDKKLQKMCAELRWTFINYCAKHGGHLASNLATIELTVMAYATGLVSFDRPLCFDAAHCTYTHKCLTGRWSWFVDDAKHNLLHPTLATVESNADLFNMAMIGSCGTLNGIALVDKQRPVILIGDGSLGNGVLMQALNVMSQFVKPVIIFNDNGQALVENVGGIYQHGPEKLLQAMNYTCVGEVDGYDLPALRSAFNAARGTTGAVYVHVHTKKGKGFAAAENDPVGWHWVNRFKIIDHDAPEDDAVQVMNVVADVVAHAPDDVYAVNAGLADTGLTLVKNELADRYVEVGIAEEQAAYTAVGLALRGKRPVIGTHAMYATRMVTALTDMLLINANKDGSVPSVTILAHDVGVNTHNYLQMGLMDTQVLGNIPGCTVISPATLDELRTMLTYTLSRNHGLTLYRIPVGLEHGDNQVDDTWVTIKTGKSNVCVLVVGLMSIVALRRLKDVDVTVVRMLVVNDKTVAKRVRELTQKYTAFVIVEDGYIVGGLGARVALALAEHNVRVKVLGLKHVNYATMEPQDDNLVLRENGYDDEAVRHQVLQYMEVS